MKRKRNTLNRWIAMLLILAVVGVPSLSAMAAETVSDPTIEEGTSGSEDTKTADEEELPSTVADEKKEAEEVPPIVEDETMEAANEVPPEEAQVDHTISSSPVGNVLMARVINTTLTKTMQSIAQTDTSFGSACKFLVGDGGKGQAEALENMQGELKEIQESLGDLIAQVTAIQDSINSGFDKLEGMLLSQNYQDVLKIIKDIEIKYDDDFKQYQKLVEESSEAALTEDEMTELANKWNRWMEENLKEKDITRDLNTLNTYVAGQDCPLGSLTYMKATEEMLRDYYPFEHQIVDQMSQVYNYAVSVQERLVILQKEKLTYAETGQGKTTETEIETNQVDSITDPDELTADFVEKQVQQVYNAGFSEFMTETFMVNEDNPPDCINIQTQIGSKMYNAYRVKANADGCYYIIPKNLFTLDGNTEDSVISDHEISREQDSVDRPDTRDITQQILFNEKWASITTPDKNYYCVTSPTELAFLDVNAGQDPLAFLINDTGRNGGLKDLAIDDIGGEEAVQGFILNAVENVYSYKTSNSLYQDSKVKLFQKTKLLKAHAYQYTDYDNAANYDTLTTTELAEGRSYRAYVIYKELLGVENFITKKTAQDESQDNLYQPTSYSGFRGETFVLGNHDVLDLSMCNETNMQKATTVVITGEAKIIGNENKTFSNMNIELMEGANLTVQNLRLSGSDGVSPVSVKGPNTQMMVVGDNQFQAVHDGEAVINNKYWFNANDYTDWTQITHQIPGLSVKSGTSISLSGSSRDNSICFTGAFGGPGISLEGDLQAENLTLTAMGSAVAVKKLDTGYLTGSATYEDDDDPAGIHSKIERKTGSGTYENVGAGIGLMSGSNTVTIGIDTDLGRYYAPHVSFEKVATLNMGQLIMNNVTVNSMSGNSTGAEDIGISSQGGELAEGSTITDSTVSLGYGKMNAGITIAGETKIDFLNTDYNLSVETMGDQLMDESSNSASAGDHAATKNNVEIRITGNKGSTDWLNLGTMGNRSGGTQTKVLNGIFNVGAMDTIELKVDGDDDWYPGKITITTPDAAQDFYSYRWISKGGTTINKSDAAYRLYIKTADDSHAGTDGDVTAQIVGESKEGTMVRTDVVNLGDLTDGNNIGNAFEKGDENTFYIGTDKNLGKATGLQLKMVSNGTASADWEVAMAKVEQINPNYSKADGFTLELCSGNLCLKDGEAGVWGRATGYTGIFKIELQTKDIKNAGTDSNVSIKINGSQGSTESIKVTSYSDHSNALERGNLDTCIVPYDTDGIGEITSITIDHDGKNAASGWDLEWARVTECVGEGEGKTKYFETDSSTQNFDKTTRTLYPKTNTITGGLENRTVTNAQHGISITGAIEEGAILEVEKHETTSETYKEFLEKSNGTAYRGVYSLKLVRADGSEASYSGTLSLSFELKDLDPLRVISVVQRIQNVYKSWAVKIPDEGKISVEIEQLTTFGILDDQGEAAENISPVSDTTTDTTTNQGNVTQSSKPKTGDMKKNIPIYVAIVLLSGFAIGFVLLRRRKWKNQK